MKNRWVFTGNGDVILLFGKYRNKTLTEINKLCPSYIGWLRHHLDKTFEPLKVELRKIDTLEYEKQIIDRENQEELWAWSFGGSPSDDAYCEQDNYYDPWWDDPFFGLEDDSAMGIL